MWAYAELSRFAYAQQVTPSLLRSLMITKLDVLDSFAEILVCVGYSYMGKTLDSFPADMSVLNNVECEYVTLKGWQCDISKCTKYDELPENAKAYLKFIEDYLEVPSMFYRPDCTLWPTG